MKPRLTALLDVKDALRIFSNLMKLLIPSCEQLAAWGF
jgi:hypothetical protein